MNRHTPILMVLSAALIALSAPAPSAVTSVTATATNNRIAAARATSTQVTWNATTNTAGAATVSSTQAILRTPGGTLLATIPQPLSKAVTGPTTASFTEAVTVPADVAVRALKEGSDQVVYERSFTDGVAASGQLTLTIATQKAAGFSIFRVALSFESGKSLEAVERDAKLKVQAEISHTGAGQIKAAWEVAGPNPNADKPEWRTIGDVSQALTGAESTTINSPALPSAITGAYLVRLRISEPAVALDQPVIRFAVIEKKN